ncbi:asparaginase domain-containing protein [Microbacterium sp. CFH 31415]|uniref:asparaginase domain-containing protein n=1 Tax=Microbacterium sp. CFH 31415 TaxID=2921732 RepID=UPI001F14867E|nr:asparaginase domain-containing protein [Microbacterium sp. CFH 31415]MCH6230825.1 asparaginase domain-containing protein [Microbacterium sp. CFH 31415]
MTDAEVRPLIAVITGPTATVVNTTPIAAGSGALAPQRIARSIEVEVDLGSAHPQIRGLKGSTTLTLPAGSLIPLPVGTDVEPEQTFFADASRLYEEIDALELDDDGVPFALARQADFTHHRAGAPGGLPGETPGVDYFAYGDGPHRSEPDFSALLRITNAVQVVADGPCTGIQWLEGTPVIEETLYWLGLLIDTRKPIVGQVAQRLHRSISHDGPRNIADGVRFIASGAWDASEPIGPVLVADGLVFSGRDVVKTAARPGGYSGGLYGPLATIDAIERLGMHYLPTRRTLASSELNVSALPRRVRGLRGDVEITTTGDRPRLVESVQVAVDIVKYGRYELSGSADPSGIERRVEQLAQVADLGGFVLEGLTQNGWATIGIERALRAAHFSGMPVVWTGRGQPAGPGGLPPAPFISAAGLPAQKARILLMAALLRFGAAPSAADPIHPTDAERAAIDEHTSMIQRVFDSH